MCREAFPTAPLDQLGVLESVKAAADIFTPVGGTVAEVNSALTENPELVNKDSYNEGVWGGLASCELVT